VNILADTSVWSLALRRSLDPPAPEVILLGDCLERGDIVVTTGLILQELLQGFHGPAQAKRIIKEFSLLPLIVPDTADHTEAAALRNHCRRQGVQAGTIDALLATLCIRHDLRLLTADKDFLAIARHSTLSLLRPPTRDV
jgi:predicted nucleic acid-binding protein